MLTALETLSITDYTRFATLVKRFLVNSKEIDKDLDTQAARMEKSLGERQKFTLLNLQALN